MCESCKITFQLYNDLVSFIAELYNSMELKESIMNTLNMICKNIKNLTMDIHERYPELYSFIDEMPVTIPDEMNPQIGIDNLEAYFDSLSYLQESYLRHRPVIMKEDLLPR